MSLYTSKGSRGVMLVNIPTNISVGYGEWSSGKVYYPDGKFLMYGSVAITSTSDQPINTRIEEMHLHSVYFEQMPCDEQGNIVMINHWFGVLSNPEWPTEDNLVLYILCEKVPTHRINLQTGEMFSVAEKGDYIRDMSFSYNIIDRRSAR